MQLPIAYLKISETSDQATIDKEIQAGLDEFDVLLSNLNLNVLSRTRILHVVGEQSKFMIEILRENDQMQMSSHITIAGELSVTIVVQV